MTQTLSFVCPAIASPKRERRWPLVVMFASFGIGCSSMIAAAANMVDVSHDVRAENTSVGMGVFVTSLVFTVGATAAAVAWAISVKSEIKSLRRENKNIQKEIDILRKVAGQDASETD